MNLPTLIADGARLHPERPALSCRERVTTYRKLVSRIERATARIQGEWQVRPGETVAYVGDGHQDAIVLFLALLQSGASLLVARQAQPGLPMLLEEWGVRLVLTDPPHGAASFPNARTEALHAIIAERCLFPAVPVPDGARQCRLIRVSTVQGSESASGGERSGEPGCAVPSVTVTGAEEILSSISPAQPEAGVPAQRLFDDGMLGPVVLSTLAGGGSLRIV